MWIPASSVAQMNSIMKRHKRDKSDTAEPDTIEGGAQLVPVFCTANVPVAVCHNLPCSSRTIS